MMVECESGYSNNRSRGSPTDAVGSQRQGWDRPLSLGHKATLPSVLELTGGGNRTVSPSLTSCPFSYFN
jgi:hypothetical protein